MRRWLLIGVMAGTAAAARAQDSESGKEPALQPEAAPKDKDAKEAPPVDEAGPAGREWFVSAGAALQKLTSLSYHVRSSARGGLIETMTPVVEADVQQIRATGGILPGWRVRTTGQSTLKSGAVTEFDVAWLVSSVEFVDHGAKLVLEKAFTDGRKNKSFSVAGTGRMDELTAVRPFTKELASTSFEPLSREVVGGVECQAVRVVTGSKIHTTWWFGVEDHLPRKSERVLGGGKGDDAFLICELTDVRVDGAPASAARNLRVSVPEGYTEDRPPRPTPAAPTPEPDGGSVKGDGTPDGAITTSSTAAPVVTGPVAAPDFELVDADGQKVSLASLRGSVVVLEFAGTWCLSTRDSRPELDALAKAHKDKPVRCYSLAVREKSREVAVSEFRKGGFEFGLLLDADSVARSYGVRAYPSFVVVDAAGMVRVGAKVYAKDTALAEVGREVDALLAGPEGKP